MRKLKLIQLTKRTSGGDSECCGGTNCPNIYQVEGTDRIVVQGIKMTHELRAALSPLDHEDAVEIPMGLVRNLIAKMG